MADLPEKIVTVTSQATYPTDPQIVVPFVPDYYTFLDLSNSAIVHASFDGINDHVYLNPNVDPGAEREKKVQKVWLRRDTAGVDVVQIVVMANTKV